MKEHRKKKTDITIHDLAAELNISASTISRGLKNDPRISAKTRNIIKSKAAELGYRPNVIAANLRSQKTNTLGVIVPRIDRHFFSSAISGIEDFAWEHGYNVIIAQSHDELEKEINCVHALYNKRVDGLIVSISMQTGSDAHFRLFTDSNIPLLFFDRFCPDIDCDRIVVDDFQSGYKITNHLIDIGRKRIAHIAGQTLLNIYKDRKDGYLAALEQSSLTFNPVYLKESNLTKEDGIKAFSELMVLTERPDAVFCGNDTTALSALAYCKQHQIKVPEEVALVGFSDEPFSALVTPSLSTVSQPGYEMGVQSAMKIITRIEDTKFDAPFEHIVLQTELIIRDSSRMQV